MKRVSSFVNAMMVGVRPWVPFRETSEKAFRVQVNNRFRKVRRRISGAWDLPIRLHGEINGKD